MADKIKAIIFDYGGVLSKHGSFYPLCDTYAPKHGKDAEKLKELLRENWDKARTNKISSKLFWKNLAKFLEVDEEIFRKDVMGYFGFRNDVFNLIKKLKKQYKTALLSNQIEDWLEKIIKEKNFKGVFNVIVTSYNSKRAKPDIKIFEETIKKLGAKPEECIYIDDLEKNRIPAEKLGMKFILFKNYNQLKRDFKKQGIDI